jgi:ATP-binding cassette subfamily A (ABC1) protein 3
MEEADKLATRVGIMKRKMLALGSVSELGEQYGDAWVVQIVLKSAPETTAEEMDAVKAWVQRKIPGVHMDKWGSRGGGHGQLRFKVLKAATAATLSTSIDHSPATTPEEAGEDKVMGNEVHAVPTNASTHDVGGIPGLIQLLESNRDEVGLEYYSVSPTTLDEVFLRVVGEEEEEGPKKSKSKNMGVMARAACCWPF